MGKWEEGEGWVLKAKVWSKEEHHGSEKAEIVIEHNCLLNIHLHKVHSVRTVASAKYETAVHNLHRREDITCQETPKAQFIHFLQLWYASYRKNKKPAAVMSERQRVFLQSIYHVIE